MPRSAMFIPYYTFEVESPACVATPITNKLYILRRTEALKKLNNNLFLIIVNAC